jgi:hypothetical protein
MITKVIFTKLAGLFIFSVFFFGCQSGPKTYVSDATIPEEELCSVWVNNAFVIKEFDHKPVNWKNGLYHPLLFPHGEIIIKIPGGSHTFLIDWEISFSRRAYETETLSAKDIVLTHDNFVAGKWYKLWAFWDDKHVRIVVEDSGPPMSNEP